MARPITTGTTPGRLRQAKSVAELKKSGGKRAAYNLPPETVRKLTKIKADIGAENETEAVIHAIDECFRVMGE